MLNERRKQLVHLAFRILDKDGSGRVDMGEIKGVFNASSHPDVIQGRRTEEEVSVLWHGSVGQFVCTEPVRQATLCETVQRKSLLRSGPLILYQLLLC